jgi:hypothetical protein
MRRRPDLGVAATKVDDGRPSLGSGSGDPSEKGDEVLLGQPSEPIGTGAHAGDRISSAPLVGELRRSTVVLSRPTTTILTHGGLRQEVDGFAFFGVALANSSSMTSRS